MSRPIEPTPILRGKDIKDFELKIKNGLEKPSYLIQTPKIGNARKLVQDYIARKQINKFNFYWRFVERPKRMISSRINKFLKRDNAFLIQKEADLMRNELVIDCPDRIVQLLGWTDQYDDDYYWVVAYKEKVELHSCVGGFIRLKNRLSGFHYYQMENNWRMNHLPMDQVLEEVENKGIVLK